MKNALLKDTIVEIKKTFKRFLSILLIILLGAGFFAGIKVISIDMKKAADNVYNEANLMDFQILSTLGLTNIDIEEIKKIEGVKDIMPAYSTDAIVKIGKTESVVKVHTLPKEKLDKQEGYLNKLNIIEGRLPENENECVTEKKLLAQSSYKIGDTIKVVSDSDILKVKEYTIVGFATTPYYISNDRGTTTLGSGKVANFLYILDSAIDSKVYTEAFITLDKDTDISMFSKHYDKIIKENKEKLEKLGDVRKKLRYDEVLGEATLKLDDAKNELEKGRKEGKEKLDDATKQLDDAKNEIYKQENLLNTNRNKANKELYNAQVKLNEGESQLSLQESEFAKQKENANVGFAQTEQMINSLKNNLDNLNNNLKLVNDDIAKLNIDSLTYNKQILDINEKLKNTSDVAEKQKLLQEKSNLETKIKDINNEIAKKKQENIAINTNITTINYQINQIETELNKGKQELANGQKQLKDARTSFNNQKAIFNKTKIDTNNKLSNGTNQIRNAKVEIEENEKKLQDNKVEFEAKIKDAKKEISDAEIKISEIKEPKWYILGRDTNVRTC